MDEYRGTDNRGNTLDYPAVTFNWIEQPSSGAASIRFWGDYAEPRRTGYSELGTPERTRKRMLEQGQHARLAAQISRQAD